LEAAAAARPAKGTKGKAPRLEMVISDNLRRFNAGFGRPSPARRAARRRNS